jgi:hypothetical protein
LVERGEERGLQGREGVVYFGSFDERIVMVGCLSMMPIASFITISQRERRKKLRNRIGGQGMVSDWSCKKTVCP